MAQLWARIVNDVIVELLPRPKPDQKIEFDRLVDIGPRPDLKVGSKWPFKTESQAIADGDLAAPGVLPTKAVVPPKEA